MNVRFPELLKAIIDDPENDLPRLQYADALDDAGVPFPEDQTAPMIRSMIAGITLGNGMRAIFCHDRDLGYGIVGRMRRGFIEELRGQRAALLLHGPEIAKYNPITKVTIQGWDRPDENLLQMIIRRSRPDADPSAPSLPQPPPALRQ